MLLLRKLRLHVIRLLLLVVILTLLPLHSRVQAAFLPWKMVAAGLNHSLAVNSRGELWGWGDNSYHQLGSGDNMSHGEPVKLMDDVVAVAAGSFHSLALTASGVVYAWGWNSSGQVGDGTTENVLKPIAVMTGAKAIEAGHEFSMAVDSKGDLYTWGDNTYGQLGLDNNRQAVRTPRIVLTSIAAISAGTYHMMALSEQGTLYTSGRNELGQTGHGVGPDVMTPRELIRDVHSISAGGWHCLALMKDGTMQVWGHNAFGQLGLGDWANRDRPTPVPNMTNALAFAGGDTFSAVVNSEGYLFTWGSDATATITTSEQAVLGDISLVSAGGSHILAVQKTGALFAWGNNLQGQLGLSQAASRGVPQCILYDVKEVTAGANHALALTQNGTLYAWGDGRYGQMAQDSARSYAEPIFILDKVTHIQAGANHNLLYSQSDQILVWGGNAYGQLGNGGNVERRRLTPLPMPGEQYSPTLPLAASSTVSASMSTYADAASSTRLQAQEALQQVQKTRVAQFAAGLNHSMLLKDNGELWVWGDNQAGQLGLDPAQQIIIANQPVKLLDNVRAIACGDNFSMAILQDRSLWVWGENAQGQLGLGDTQNRATPVKLMEGVQAVSGGRAHMLIISDDNTLWVCGDNTFSQLGLGSAVAKESLKPVRAMSGVRTIAAAGDHSLAVGVDGQAWGWGSNADQQLSASEQNIFFVPGRIAEGVQNVSAGTRASYLLKQDGSLWSLGSTSYGQLGDGQMTAAFYGPQRVKLAPQGTKDNVILQVDRSMMWAMGELVAVDAGRDTAPRLIDNMTMLPIRAVVDMFGGTVQYDPDSQSTILALNGHVLEISTGSMVAKLDGAMIQITAPLVRNERTLVHIRVLERLGLKIVWDANDESITLSR